MSANIQVISFIYSFTYGCLFSLFVYIIGRKYISRHLLVRLFIDSFLVFAGSILYMYGLYKINFGILHLYFIFVFIIGYFLVHVKLCKSSKK